VVRIADCHFALMRKVGGAINDAVLFSLMAGSNIGSQSTRVDKLKENIQDKRAFI
ncbi:jg17174, partial [Pararge aegeria aegeria]